MRSRPLAAASVALALALFTASCGGDDEPVVTPTSGDITPPSSPVTAATTPEASPADTPEATSSANGGDKSEPPTRTPSDDLLPAVAAKNSDLTNFTTALGAASLAGTLGQTGPYTVFAPNNDAFAKLGTRLDTLLQPASKADLVNILSFHVVSGDVRLKDLKDGDLLNTLQGTRLRVDKKGDEITIGNSLGSSKIVSSDVEAGNGVIHVIDTVLTPKTK